MAAGRAILTGSFLPARFRPCVGLECSGYVPLMPERRTVRLERLCIDGAGRDRWFIRPGRVRGRWVWFDPHEVPLVDAKAAWFEIERVRGGWRVLRHMEDQP